MKMIVRLCSKKYNFFQSGNVFLQVSLINSYIALAIAFLKHEN